MQERHEFAIYYPLLSFQIKNIANSELLKITDLAIINRITGILRLRPGEEVLFFDDKLSAHCCLHSVNKKELLCTILAQHKHHALKPALTVILPLLKKDDFETALYSLVELGATTIQLVTTEKTQRAWGADKELERCHRIMIAAAEQSKNFALPELMPPISLKTYLPKIADQSIPKIYFDPQGKAPFEILRILTEKKASHYVLMVGPEGDLTIPEKDLLLSQSFQFCQLTPTVLRSVSAIAVGVGMIRSILRA